MRRAILTGSVLFALLLPLMANADDVQTVNHFVIDYIRKGPPGVVPGVWNTQPAGAFIFSTASPPPRSPWDPNPARRMTTAGVSMQLPDPDQANRGVFGNEALAEYGIMVYRCDHSHPGGCTGTDPNVHRFVWMGACPGQAAFCTIQGGIKVLGGQIGITHNLEKVNGVPTGRYILRVGIHGQDNQPPGVTDAIQAYRANAYDPSIPFVRCSASDMPCDQQFPGTPIRAPLFPAGMTVTLHVATTAVSLNPVCQGLTEVDCMLSGIPGSFSAAYLHHAELAPCVAVRTALLPGGQVVPDIVNCTD